MIPDIKMVNVLFTIIYLGGFRIIYNKKDKMFRLGNLDNLLERDDKHIKTYNEMHKILYKGDK